MEKSITELLSKIKKESKDFSVLDREHIKVIDNILFKLTRNTIYDHIIDQIKNSKLNHDEKVYEIWLNELQTVLSQIKAKKAYEVIQKNNISIYKYENKTWKIYFKEEFDIKYLFETLNEAQAELVSLYAKTTKRLVSRHWKPEYPVSDFFKEDLINELNKWQRKWLKLEFNKAVVIIKNEPYDDEITFESDDV
jgi:hypothetical protein